MVRVLFVDDDPAALQPVVRLMRRKAEQWAMSFVDSASAALTKLEGGAFDVLVCGQLSGRTHGVQLLRWAELQHPAMARVYLAKQLLAPSEAAPAHAFMLMPVEDDLLCDVVDELAQSGRDARLPPAPAAAFVTAG